MPPLFNFIPSRFAGLVILGLLILGAISYVPTYSLVLKNFDERSMFPFTESAKLLNSTGERSGVFTMHPDLLARCYKGPIYKLPEKGGFEHILEEAKRKGVRYLIIDSTSVSSPELLYLYLYSLYGGQKKMPPEFVLLEAAGGGGGGYALYMIQTQVEFKAAIFSHLEWGFHTSWEKMLALMGGSISTFDDAAVITEVDFSQFNVVVFADFTRPLDDTERLYLEEFIQNGLFITVSGLSPYYLAGGTTDLTRISSWFGATVFSEAPKEARWKMKFTEDARQIMENLDLDYEYSFYKDSRDWSTPTGCHAQPESVVYAYRVDDETAAIFSHKFGEGAIVFTGARHGFVSPDMQTFEAFLRALILSIL